MKPPLSLYRKRFIPEELVHLKNDILLVKEDNLLVTRWDTLRPRQDIAGGISAYYLDLGIKVSKIFNKDHELVYWYCDIFQLTFGSTPDIMIFEDLLVDVIVYEDGSFKVLDLDELADALELRLITEIEVRKALRILDSLLKIIDQNKFYELKEQIEKSELLYFSSSI